MGEGTNPQLARFPDKAVLRDYIEDIKRRIGAEGHRQTRLAVMLGHLSFDHGDAEATKFIALGFELALETDVAIGFHIDDSMFWVGRKDLWSDPNNVEALDWDGTPGFSTYPAPARFDDIYEELAKHKQVGWASSEGTNLQLGSGRGQSGMTMETYLAKMFNHGGTLVNIFSWGIGGEANKNMSFRRVTEGEEALQAYRKFLKGDQLVEAKTDALTLLERLPSKIHQNPRGTPCMDAEKRQQGQGC
jgi:hypothetical protein